MGDRACFPEAEDSPPSSPGSVECCKEHEECLSMFCLDDLEPLCKHRAADSHAGHRVYLLTEAAVDCKEELKTSLNDLNMKLDHFKQVTHTCRHASKYNQAEAKLTDESMRREFERLHQFLRQEETARLLSLRKEKEEKMRRAEEKINRMNQLIKSLEEKIRLIDEELDSGGEGEEFLKHYQDSMNSSKVGHMGPEKISGPLIDVAKHLGNLQYDVWEKIKHIAPYTSVTLDPRTADPSMKVHPGLDRFEINPGCCQGMEQHMGGVVPAVIGCFHKDSYILAREGFSTGEHSWGIEVGDTDNWTVGVAAPSALGKEGFEAHSEAGIWCISLQDGEYRTLTTPPQTLSLDDSQRLNRVLVRLDCDGGTLEFKNADSDALLFTFRHCFAEKVYPYFKSTSLGGSLRVLEQRVNIRVDSDCVSVENKVWEDEAIKVKPPAEEEIEKINRKTDTGCLTEDEKEAAVCSVNEKIPRKPSEKENTSTKMRKVKRKTRFNVTYHVSLNRALNVNNNQGGNLEHTNVDDRKCHPCGK